MKLRERWLPLAATLALVALCAAAPAKEAADETA